GCTIKLSRSGSGAGTNVQSEPHASATGRCWMMPTEYWRIRAASSELTVPSPVTSQARCCSLESPRLPTAACRAHAASSDETAAPGPEALEASTSQVPLTTFANEYCPSSAV